jgi:DNA adenine methylase
MTTTASRPAGARRADTDQSVRTPVPYFGGKQRTARRIIDLFPAHGHYVEPFAGSLAVLLAKRPSDHETVNDLDEHLMTWWRVLRERPEALARVCALTPHARAEHRAAVATDLDTIEADLEIARLVWVQLTQGRAGLRRRTGWRHYQAPASGTSMPSYLTGYVSRIAAAAARLQHVSLECRPALDVIADYGRHDSVLLYVDPPYLPSTRTAGAYLHEMTTADHVDLLTALTRVRSAVVLSGYTSPLYEAALTGWHRTEIPTTTGQGGRRQERIEVIWTNRETPTPDLFHTHTAEETDQ